MDALGIAIFVLVLAFIFGDLDKYIPNQQLKLINKLELENNELKEIRKLDLETIEELQKRLEENNLDSSVG